MKHVLIVGLGNIGTLLYQEYAKLSPDRYDPYKGYNEKKGIVYDVAFVAVDTPMNEDGSADISQVLTAINETDAKIIVLRSTVPVGTTDKLKESTGKSIVFCPEFYGTTQHSSHKSFDFSYTILGGNKENCGKVVQLLQEVYDARHMFFISDAKTAELAKYMENTMLASKVAMCVQFYKIAKQFDISYPELRELVLQDERIGRSHTFVYEDRPFFDSHCFNKDLLAITKFSDAPLIESVLSFNEQCKKKQDSGI